MIPPHEYYRTQDEIEAARLQNNLRNHVQNNLQNNQGGQITGKAYSIRQPSGKTNLRLMVATAEGGTDDKLHAVLGRRDLAAAHDVSGGPGPPRPAYRKFVSTSILNRYSGVFSLSQPLLSRGFHFG